MSMITRRRIEQEHQLRSRRSEQQHNLDTRTSDVDFEVSDKELDISLEEQRRRRNRHAKKALDEGVRSMTVDCQTANCEMISISPKSNLSCSR